jgi:hypothetical protein
MRKNFTYLCVAFFLCTFTFLTGQTLIWPTADTTTIKTSQFKGGLNGWTTRGGTVDASGNFFEKPNVKWVWSPTGKRFIASDTYQSGAFTAGNGIALFDSEFVTDSILKSNDNQFGELTSPNIDIDGKNNITLVYNSFFSNFSAQTFVAWSEDGGATWKDTLNVVQYLKVGVNVGLTSNVASNEHPIGTFSDSYSDDDVKLKLVGSKGTKNFKIKFLFTGRSYFWFVDDVELYTFNNDMQVNRNFFAIAPNYETPFNQVEAISFLSDISNQGNVAQPNVKLSMLVRNLSARTIAFADTLNYGSIKPDSTAENKLMTKTFTPPQSKAVYRGSYRIASDSSDQYRFNDTASTLFRVTDSVFSKEIGGSYSTGPADFLFGTSNVHSWRVGNYFYVVKGKSSTATKISARIGNSSDLKGKTTCLGFWFCKSKRFNHHRNG